jgi:DNA-binding IclR family transcriptional regulator
VLDVLVAHPTERLSVSELARRAEISKPTCMGIARALVAAGYLDCDPRKKTYGLGPALITAGRAALESVAPLALVHDEASALSERFGLPTTAAAFDQGHLVIIERAGPESTYDPLIQIGIRLPLVPPTGKMAMIFGGDDEIERWLDRGSEYGERVDRARLAEVAADARAAGYLVSRAGESSHLLATLLERLAGRGLSDEVVAVVSEVATSFGDEEYLQRDLRPGQEYPVSTVSAPVYDVNLKVKLLLVLYVAADGTSYVDVHRYGDALVSAADRLTTALGGRDPWRSPRP